MTKNPERATRDISALLQRFENIIEYKPVSGTLPHFRLLVYLAPSYKDFSSLAECIDTDGRSYLSCSGRPQCRCRQCLQNGGRDRGLDPSGRGHTIPHPCDEGDVVIWQAPDGGHERSGGAGGEKCQGGGGGVEEADG